MNTKQLLQLHENTCKSCRAIMEQKNSDYTGGKSSTDPFANFNASSILGIHPVQGLLLRVIDKIQRIRSFTNDKELNQRNRNLSRLKERKRTNDINSVVAFYCYGFRSIN